MSYSSPESLPDLDAVVFDALRLFENAPLPDIPFLELKKPLVLGSGNAAAVGKILFEDTDAHYADESSYAHALSAHREHIASAVIISASGGKDAAPIAEALKAHGTPTWLLTNNEGKPPAAEYVDPSRLVVFPNNPEPYTYNVSTYMGMLLSKTHEDPAAIRHFLEETAAKAVPDTLGKFDAFYFIISSQFIAMKDMFLTKFDELFGARVSARAFTLAQTKHAKTVVPSPNECFIAIGEENHAFGDAQNRVHIPLPDNAGYAAMMAIGYHVIGRIQAQHPPYFKDNIGRYVQEASKLFGENISVIIE
jgi:hypothetical protein